MAAEILFASINAAVLGDTFQAKRLQRTARRRCRNVAPSGKVAPQRQHAQKHKNSICLFKIHKLRSFPRCLLCKRVGLQLDIRPYIVPDSTLLLFISRNFLLFELIFITLQCPNISE